MGSYTPDRWVMVEATSSKGESVRKILASWYGGFANGDSWKLSSGIVDAIDHGDHIEFPQHSGSVYFCGKGNYGMSMYTNSILLDWQERMAESNIGNIVEVDEAAAMEVCGHAK